MAQSTRKIILTVLGHGMEPKLDFNMGHVSFDPILPHSLGDEKEVIVSNPCPFAVEMYSLEFDKQYLQEEEVRLPPFIAPKIFIFPDVLP